MRRPPPFVVRCLVGVMMFGVAAPALWLLHRLGLTVRLAFFMTRRQQQKTAAKNPFKGWMASEHERRT